MAPSRGRPREIRKERTVSKIAKLVEPSHVSVDFDEDTGTIYIEDTRSGYSGEDRQRVPVSAESWPAIARAVSAALRSYRKSLAQAPDEHR